MAALNAAGFAVTLLAPAPSGPALVEEAVSARPDVRAAEMVSEAAGLLGRGAYQLKDGTGQLTVLSEISAPPPKGSNVGVKGIFESLLTIGSKSLAVLREQSRFNP